MENMKQPFYDDGADESLLTDLRVVSISFLLLVDVHPRDLHATPLFVVAKPMFWLSAVDGEAFHAQCSHWATNPRKPKKASEWVLLNARCACVLFSTVCVLICLALWCYRCCFCPVKFLSTQPKPSYRCIKQRYQKQHFRNRRSPNVFWSQSLKYVRLLILLVL